ncbi:cell wall surface anchor family protein [Planoprotostelium fungivorum]|uniref:Cell wall surface anchor family protein n=1 Tax=Planoprotostelium fungivorum TaxID=1890364 RepID=A0A2P6NVV3_9EUKA|nr:cell wall surface anchor family protein [Planoprotostelium fungivorum]
MASYKSLAFLAMLVFAMQFTSVMGQTNSTASTVTSSTATAAAANSTAALSNTTVPVTISTTAPAANSTTATTSSAAPTSNTTAAAVTGTTAAATTNTTAAAVTDTTATATTSSTIAQAVTSSNGTHSTSSTTSSQSTTGITVATAANITSSGATITSAAPTDATNTTSTAASTSAVATIAANTTSAAVITSAAANTTSAPVTTSAAANTTVAPVTNTVAANSTSAPVTTSAAANTTSAPVTVSTAANSTSAPVTTGAAVNTTSTPTTSAAANTTVAPVTNTVAANSTSAPVTTSAAANTTSAPVTISTAANTTSAPVTTGVAVNTTSTPATTSAAANTTIAPITSAANTTRTITSSSTSAPINTTSAPVNTSSTSAPISSTSAPVNVSSTSAPVNVSSTSAPVNISSTSAPINVSSTSAPINVSSTSAPVNISSTSAPVNISSTSAPVNVSSTSAPVNISSTSAPVNISSTSAPVNISSTSAPVNVSSTSAPVNVSSTSAPVNISSTTTRSVNLTSSSSISSTSAPPATSITYLQQYISVNATSVSGAPTSVQFNFPLSLSNATWSLNYAGSSNGSQKNFNGNFSGNSFVTVLVPASGNTPFPSYNLFLKYSNTTHVVTFICVPTATPVGSVSFTDKTERILGLTQFSYAYTLSDVFFGTLTPSLLSLSLPGNKGLANITGEGFGPTINGTYTLNLYYNSVVVASTSTVVANPPNLALSYFSPTLSTYANATTFAQIIFVDSNSIPVTVRSISQLGFSMYVLSQTTNTSVSVNPTAGNVLSISFPTAGRYQIVGTFPKLPWGTLVYNVNVTARGAITSTYYNGYSSLTIVFNQAIDQFSPSPVNCSQYVNGLPTGSICSWNSSTNLFATLPASSGSLLGSIILPAASLTANQLAVLGQAIVQTIYPINPSLTLSPDQAPGLCTASVLTANVQNGPSNVIWSGAVIGSSFTGNTFSVPAGLPSGFYQVTASVTNFMGYSATQTYNFSIPLPSLQVTSGGNLGSLSVTASGASVFSLSLAGSACLPTALTYSWTLSSIFPIATGNQATFTVAPYTMTVGTWTVRASVSWAGQTISAAPMTVTVVSQPPTMIITPGTQFTVGYGQPLTLDASQSVNYDSKSALVGSWSLLSATDATTSVLSFPGLVWALPVPFLNVSIYTFQLNLASYPSIVTNVTVTVTSNIPPSIDVTLPVGFQPANKFIRIDNNITTVGGQSYSTQWTITPAPLVAFPTTQDVLFIPANSLQVCANYTLSVSASTSNAYGITSFKMSTVCPPVPPTNAATLFNFYPLLSDGLQGSTLFNLNSTGWISPTLCSLEFTFSYLTTDDSAQKVNPWVLVSGSTAGRIFSSTGGNEFTFFVTATDIYGTSTTVNQTFTVQPDLGLTTTQAVSFVSAGLVSTDAATATGSQSAVLSIIKSGSSSNSSETTQLLNNLAGSIDAFTRNLSPSNPISYSIASSTLSNMGDVASLSASTSVRSSAKRADVTVSASLSNAVQNILNNLALPKTDVVTADTLASVMQVIELTLSNVQTAGGSSSSVYDVVNAATSALFQNRFCDTGSPLPSYIGAQSNVSLTVDYVSSKTLPASYSLGGQQIQFSTAALTGCSQLVLMSLPFDTSSPSPSGSSIRNGNSSVVTITGASLAAGATVAIKFPLSATDSAVAGQFFCAYRSNHTQSWESDSTVTYSHTGSSATCTTTHLTEFAVQNGGASTATTSSTASTVSTSPDAGQNSSSNSGLSAGAKAGIAIGVIAGVAVIAAVIIALVVRHKKLSRSKVNPNNVEMTAHHR